MKEIKIKLYTFDELEKKIQDIIIEQYQYKHDLAEVYYSDWDGTLKEFQKLMGIKVKNWEVSESGYDYRVQFQRYTYFPDGYMREIDGDDIKGKHLWRYLINNVWDDINQRKVYHTKEWNKEKSDWAKKRTSRIIRGSWHDCPLSGMGYDYDILEPIAEYLSKPYKDNYTLHDLVSDCLDSFFSAWRREIEYCNSYEGIKEWLTERDDNEYYANGKMFDGVLEEE